MKQLIKLNENKRGRDFVVGDLHGCYEELMSKLEDHGFDSAIDRLISVGDLIDRGPDSFRCLSLTNEPWFYCVWGNHEALMLDALSNRPGSPEFQFWMQNGGEWALGHDLDELHQMVLELAKRTPLAIEVPYGTKCVGVIHAEVPDDDWQSLSLALAPKEAQRAIWGRTTISSIQSGLEPSRVTGIDYTIFGHTPVREAVAIANRLYLDTGGGHPWGSLTLKEVGSIISGSGDE